jgi:hypothetical protein
MAAVNEFEFVPFWPVWFKFKTFGLIRAIPGPISASAN